MASFRTRKSWLVLLVVFTIVVVLLTVMLPFGRVPQKEPVKVIRHDQDSETINVPTGAPANSDFVGHQRCAECHTEIHRLHVNMPHARTMAATNHSEHAKQLCRTTHSGGEGFGTFHYQCDDEGLTAELPERFPGRLFPLDYAFGSGEHAVTFLTLLKDGDETVSVEHRLSWYHHLDRLDVTPGQQDEKPEHSMEYFGKVFRGEEMHRCVNCHVTTGRVRNGTIHDLAPGVHCEKCHGPGAKHVTAATRGDDMTLNSQIRSRWDAFEQITMCGECHRLPQDITPDRLKLYPDSLVRFQPVGLLQSRCYLNSEAQLSCTSCHDPHDGIRSRTMETQEDTCRSCHQPQSASSCGANRVSDCISCHMPPIELVPGISFHDHWIRVRKDEPLKP